MSIENPSFWAVLPAIVRYNNNLSSFEKLMYAEISALTNKNGICWAGNSYFSNLFSKTEVTISRAIKKLKDEQLIKIAYRKRGAEITERAITIVISEKLNVDNPSLYGNEDLVDEQILSTINTRHQSSVNKNDNRTVNKNDKYNNTSINNKKEKYKKEKRIFGEFENVLLTEEEFEKLKSKVPSYQNYIEDLSIYLENNLKKHYDSHYATILSWHRKDKKKNLKKGDGDYERL